MAYVRVGDLVKSLEPMIRERMRQAFDEAIAGAADEARRAYTHPAAAGKMTASEIYQWGVRARAAGWSNVEVTEVIKQWNKTGQAPATIDGTASAAAEVRRGHTLNIIDDPYLDDWRDRARAAGLTEAEIERAEKIQTRSDLPLVINGTAREVNDE